MVAMREMDLGRRGFRGIQRDKLGLAGGDRLWGEKKRLWGELLNEGNTRRSYIGSLVLLFSKKKLLLNSSYIVVT